MKIRVEEVEGNPSRGSDSLFSQSSDRKRRTWKLRRSYRAEEERQLAKGQPQECQVTLGPSSVAML